MTDPVLARLLRTGRLTAREIRATFGRLVDPRTADVERAAILIALAGRSLSVPELAAFAGEMRRRATPFPLPSGDAPVDLCGSGGAPRPSYNVSTVSAVVVAAAGAPVVKHGNRSARGVCGSSDLLEALGLPVTRSRGFGRATYRAHRLAFLHAPLYHPATAAVAGVRRALGLPTVFNRLGPLSNPARVPFQVVGAPDLPTAEMFSRVLDRMGVRQGISMSSVEGCDEFSPQRLTNAVLWDHGRFRTARIDPRRWIEPDDRRGPWGPLPPAEAADEAERILSGGGGARRGAVRLTSGAALWTAGRTTTLDAGIAEATAAIDDGRAADLLADLRRIARQYRREGG